MGNALSKLQRIDTKLIGDLDDRLSYARGLGFLRGVPDTSYAHSFRTAMPLPRERLFLRSDPEYVGPDNGERRCGPESAAPGLVK